jgi:hypothetical protein
MHTSLKIIKTLLYSYSALHVSGILAPIIRSLLILHIQPLVTVCRWVDCVFQLWSVTTVAFVCLWVGIDQPSDTRKRQTTVQGSDHCKSDIVGYDGET